MGTFLAALEGLSATIFGGFRGSEAHLERSSTKMLGVPNSLMALGQKNEKKRPGGTRKSLEKVTRKRHQKAPRRCQKGAQETLGTSKIPQHGSPKPPSKTTRLPAYNTTKKLQNHKTTRPSTMQCTKLLLGVGLVG